MNRTSPHTSWPLVTIVIPCFNQAHFLPEAIESADNQTYPNFEIIVIDDGSPDNTSEVAARYPGIRCVRQKNSGLSEARNRGIRESRGEFLVFLDADDRLLPNCLEAGIGCFAERPEAAIVFGRYRVINKHGRVSNSGSTLFEGDDLYRGLLTINCIGMVSVVMYRRSVFDKIGGFDPAISPAADYDLYLRIARVYPSHRHRKIVAEYRVYETSMSNDHAVMLRAVIIGMRTQWRYVKNNPHYEAAYYQGRQLWWDYYGEPLYMQTARQMWKASVWQQTIRGLWYLLLYYPQVMMRHGSNRWNKLVARLKST